MSDVKIVITKPWHISVDVTQVDDPVKPTDPVDPPIPPEPTTGFHSITKVRSDAPVPSPDGTLILSMVLGGWGTGGGGGQYGDQWLGVMDSSLEYKDLVETLWRVSGGGNTAKITPQDSIVNDIGTAIATFWYGHVMPKDGSQPSPTEEIKTEDGMVVAYTDLRLEKIVADTYERYPNIDKDKGLSVGGNSMGGFGSIFWGCRHPKLVHSIWPAEPAWKLRDTYDVMSMVTGRGGWRDPGIRMKNAVQSFADFTDMIAYVSDPANDIPPILWGCGAADNGAPMSWADNKAAAAALKATRRFFVMTWTGLGHGGGYWPMNSQILKQYSPAQFSLTYGYPVFENCSIDDDLEAPFPPGTEEEIRGINLYLKFRNVLDEINKFTVEVTAVKPCEFDVSPRGLRFAGDDKKHVVITVADQWQTLEWTDVITPIPPIDPPIGFPGTGEAKVLKAIQLGNTGPWLTSVHPGYSVEASSYSHDSFLHYWKTKTFTWTWVIGEDTTYPKPNPAPRMRMCVDGSPVSEWQDNVNGNYAFAMNVENGHHIAHPELENTASRCCSRDFVVNDTGAPLETQEPWTSTNRFDMHYSGIGNCAIKIKYPGALPMPRYGLAKERIAAEVTKRLSNQETWARTMVASSYVKNFRRYVNNAHGDVFIETEHKYHHHEAAADPHLSVISAPMPTMRSGPRYVGALGYIADLLIRPNNAGAYFLETNGRFGLVSNNGTVINEGGWDVPSTMLKDHVVPMRGHQFMYANDPAEVKLAQDHYKSKFVMLGKWDQVKGPHFMWEPWGFTSIPHPDDHEFWIADTRNHRILFLDHWTAHRPEKFQKAHFPPPWYQQVEESIGVPTFCSFIGSEDGTATEYCNEPWKCRFDHNYEKLLWSNFMGDSIYSGKTDGSGILPVIVSAKKYTNEELGVTSRLGGSNKTPAQLRALVVDGPVGTASCIRPTAIDIFSNGDIGWIEHYTFAIRRLDIITNVVTTLGYLEGASTVPNMVIDNTGSWGVKDDIFTNAWFNNTDKRYDKNGVYIGRWSMVGGSQMGISGTRDHVMNGAFYGWGFDVRHGKLLTSGNASGNQLIEYTAKVATDPAFNFNKWVSGYGSWMNNGYLQNVHGGLGQGELGFTNLEEFNAMTDEEIREFMALVPFGVQNVEDIIYFIRTTGREFQPLTSTKVREELQ